ncbi:hypothetical protein K474DRAFT_1664569 [Panus rudis PR-1116 ss-1]|nr:hypothetical protein K474DRAFT_1664569 [Panus rudis PR-1116 ss-1]
MNALRARTPATMLRSTGPRQMRLAHDAARPHAAFPFTFDKRKGFLVKYLVFMSTGFSIPWIAVYWQLRKSAAAA